jgi:hypothetical protein
MNTDLLLGWMQDRAREPSTYRGIAGLLTAFGIVITPMHFEMIVSIGISVISLINVFKKDAKQ